MSNPQRTSWRSIFRMGLVQTALGSIVVLTTSTMNRVMVVELALPAMLPGALVALHFAVQMLRPRLGYGSDDGGLAIAAPCTGTPTSGQDHTVCVRQPGGTWQDYDLSALTGADAGTNDVTVGRWVPRADGRAVQSGARVVEQRQRATRGQQGGQHDLAARAGRDRHGRGRELPQRHERAGDRRRRLDRQ